MRSFIFNFRALALAAALLTACAGGSNSIPAPTGASSVRFSSGLDAALRPPASADWLQFGLTPAHVGFNSLETTLGVGNVSGLTSLWSFTPTNNAVEDPILIDNGVAYVNSNDYLYALNASTGAVIWQYETYEAISGQNAPAIDGPRIILPCLINGNSQKNAMCAINTTTGKRVWAFYSDCNCEPPASVGSDPVVSGNYVAFNYANGSTSSDYLVVANASTGKSIWTYTLAHGPDYYTAAIDSGAVYFYATGTSICSANLTNGSINWCTSTGSESVPTISGGVVYANTISNGLYALDASTGTQLWQYTPSAGSASGQYDPAAVAKGRVYISGISCCSATLYALNAKTGAVDFIAAPGSGIHQLVSLGCERRRVYFVLRLLLRVRWDKRQPSVGQR
jgi:outer membrane protein assembly factor BamB